MYFTDGLQSLPLVKPHIELDEVFDDVILDPKRPVMCVELLLNKEKNIFYGVRFLDEDRTVIVQKESEDDVTEGSEWERLKVPNNREIIGMHGVHDGIYVRGLGLIVWKPKTPAPTR